MRIGRTLPPAAAPIGWKAFLNGLVGILHGDKEIERFESELKVYFQKKHCFLVSSGKAALTLILLALKERYPERTEVIIPAYTCYSVPSAIVRAGLEIRICDLTENSFDFNFEQLRPMLDSDKLLAVLPTHLFGLPANVEKLKNLINDSHVAVIEDAAQAMGGEWQGNKLGTQGDVGFFSLGRGKAFSTVEGGIVIMDDALIAEKMGKLVKELENYSFMSVLRIAFYAVALNVLLRPNLFWIPKAMPFLKLGETVFDPNFSIKKISSLQAGLARGWKFKLESFRKNRKINIKQLLTGIDKFFIPNLLNDAGDLPDLIRLPILLADRSERDAFILESENSGLGVASAYPDVVSSIVECSESVQGQSFASAKIISQSLVTLPLHSFVAKNDLEDLLTTMLLLKDAREGFS